MARKRLNKKVAIIGSATFIFVLVLIIGVILYLSQDPEKFIKDGDLLLQQAQEETDEELKDEKYQKVAYNYHKARGLAKSDKLRIDILFKLADLYIEIDEWMNAMGCWNKIISIEPENMKARFNKLKYVYIVADSGLAQVWQDVDSAASDFLEIIDEDVYDEDIAQWDCFTVTQAPPVPLKLGPCLYLFRGRAAYETARRGALTDPNESLVKAVNDMEKVLQLQPDNIDAYMYLSETMLEKGSLLVSEGNLEARDKAVEQAKEFLEKAVEISDNPRAHINLIKMKFKIDRTMGKEKILALEPEYLELVQKFSSNAEAYNALSEYYLYQQLRVDHLEKALDAIQKAIELDRENVSYALAATNIYYRRYFLSGEKELLEKAIKVVENALAFPGAQESRGPRSWVNKSSRTSLYTLLAMCNIEQIVEAEELSIDEDTKKRLLTDAENAVHQIEQLMGSGEDPRVVKWQGMLELAKGNRKEAVKKLYATYEHYKASIKNPAQMDAHLAYALGQIFQNTREIGANLEYSTSALNAYFFLTKPKAILDHADILLKLEQYNRVLNMIDLYENSFAPDKRSKVLRIGSYIGAGQFDQAVQELEKAELEEASEIKLKFMLIRVRMKRARTAAMRQQVRDKPLRSGETAEHDQTAERLMIDELKDYRRDYAQLLGKLLAVEPNAVNISDIIYICDYYITEGQLNEARNVIEKFLGYFPEHITAQVYSRVLNEPDPANISLQQRNEIEKQVIETIDDPTNRALNLGMFHLRANEPNEAMELFKEIADLKQIQQQPDIELTGSQRMAIRYLFDIAFAKKDWNTAEQVVDIARRLDFDGCEGNFFDGRLIMAKTVEADEQDVRIESLKKAIAKFDDCLQQRPVFSQCYLFRSRVNNALGNEHAAIEDAKKAVAMNPLDGDIAKQLAFVLYQLNRKLGDTVTYDQVIETKAALARALKTNPKDIQLLSFYAEYISDENPEEAISIRQNLLSAVPTLQNAVLLGRLAMRVAQNEIDSERQQTLHDIAGAAFEQARQIEPDSKEMLASYARYFEVIGRGEKAAQLLSGSQNRKLLWQYYYQSGQLEQAKSILEQLYKTDQKDIAIIRGLLLVAIQEKDAESAKNYSEKLIAFDDSMGNLIYQIRVYLTIGLIEETENKLQSFKEKYPDNSEILLFEAWLRMKQGQIADSLALVNRTLEADPENAKAWLLRGEANRYMGDYAKAIIDIKRSKALENEPSTRIALAKTYLKMDLAEDAITELKNTVDDPKAPPETRLLLEQTYQHLGRTDDMIKFYRETLEKFPDSVVWNNKAAAFAATVRDLEWAEKLYKHAYDNADEKTQGRRTAFNGYLNVLLARRKMDKMLAEAAKHVDTDLAPVAFGMMAEAKLKLGDRQTAVDYYRKAIDKAGANDALIAGILRSMFQMLGGKEVLRYCDAKLRAEPDSLAANVAMFNLAKMNGEFNKALDYVEKCMKIAEDDESLWLEYSIQKAMVLQRAYMRTSDNSYLQKAIEQYESLLEKMPNNISILNNLAYMLADNDEQLDKALKYAGRVYELTSSNPDYLDTYAYVLYKNGKYKRADEIINSAIQQIENTEMFALAEMYEHLGMIKSALGEKTSALEAYKQALDVGEKRLSDTAKERIKQAVDNLSY